MTPTTDVRHVIAQRRSIRRFLGRPVDIEQVRAILATASRAPSGSNTQPWGVDVVSGTARDRISHRVLAALEDEVVRKPYYPYLPEPLPDPARLRQSDFAVRLGALDQIDRRSSTGPKQSLAWNYRFFGAPVGLFFHLDRAMQYGSWVDLGLFMQNVMLLARADGLDTCPQVSWANYGTIVQAELGIPKSRVIVAGMSLGYADPEALPNRLETPREPVDGFARFHG